MYAPYKKPTQIFGNVRCPILLVNQVRRCAAWLTDIKQADLNWKLKISKTADNAGITQS